MPTIKKLIATTTSILFTLNRSLMMIYHLNSLLNTFATLLTAPVEATSAPDTADLPTDLPVFYLRLQQKLQHCQQHQL